MNRRLRLAGYCSAGLTCVLWLALLLGYAVQRDVLLDQTASRLQQQQVRLAEGLRQVFERAERRVREVALQMRSVQLSNEQIVALLSSRLLHDGEIVQFGLLLEPDRAERSGGRFAVSITYGVRGIEITDFVQTGYDYWTKDWYLKTLASADGWWSEPYFNDAAGGQDTITFDYPLEGDAGKRIGMLSVSVALDRIDDWARSLAWRAGESSGDYVLLDGQGRLLVAWDSAIERAYVLEDALTRRDRPLLHWLLEQPADRLRSVRRGALGEGQTLVQVPVEPVGWRVAAAAEDRVELATLRWQAGLASLLALLVGLAAGGLILRLGRDDQRPLHALGEVAERLAAGELEQALPAFDQDVELQRVAQVLEWARLSLLDQSGPQREARDVRLREAGQRLIASELQRALLPEERLFFGARLQAQLSGVAGQDALRERGLFGFFSAAPGICVFYRGRIESGTVSSMLLAARLTCLLPSEARQGGLPSSWLHRLHMHMQTAEQIEGQIHLLLGRLDLGTGLLHLASAGHSAPLLLDADRAELLDVPVGQPLARNESDGWRDWRGELHAGDRLLLLPDLSSAAADDGASSERIQALRVAAERQREQAPHVLLRAARDALLAAASAASDSVALQISLQHRD